MKTRICRLTTYSVEKVHRKYEMWQMWLAIARPNVDVQNNIRVSIYACP